MKIREIITGTILIIFTSIVFIGGGRAMYNHSKDYLSCENIRYGDQYKIIDGFYKGKLFTATSLDSYKTVIGSIDLSDGTRLISNVVKCRNLGNKLNKEN